jgi:hypothetical protein
MAVQLPTYRGEELKDVSVKDEVRVAAKRFFQPLVAITGFLLGALQGPNTRQSEQKRADKENTSTPPPKAKA